MPAIRTANGKRVAHGTMNAYSNYRCRCTPCRKANAEYRAKLRAKAKGVQR